MNLILGIVAVSAALAHLLAEDRLGPLGPIVKAMPVAVLGILVFKAAERRGRILEDLIPPPKMRKRPV